MKAEELRQHGTSPMWWYIQARKHVLFPLHRMRPRSESWTRLIDEDWDTLFVIDGCRLDLFEEVMDTSEFDEFRRINSGASGTPEWVDRQFHGAALTDTIYVTANPVVSQNVPTSFFLFDEPWREHFDDDLGTVPAEPVADRIRELRSEYPDKRIIAHFNQPHYPFVTRPDLRYKDTDSEVNNVWGALQAGLVDRETVWSAYAENLKYVMDVVEPLARDLDERTVITSDHGNLLGEHIWPVPLRQWGHPTGLRHPNLTNVPWVVIGGQTSGRDDVDSEISDRLAALGYREDEVERT